MRRSIGTIRKRGNGSWELAVTVGKDPETGKQRRIYKTIRGSRADAERALMALAVNTGMGDAVRNRLTLDAYWSGIYLPNVESRLRGRTVAGYKANYESMVRPTLGSLNLDQITPPVIESWLSGFEGNRRKHDALRFLRMLLRQAVRSRVLDRDPTDHVDSPKYRRYQPTVLDSEQASRYIMEARGTDVEPVILLALGAGLRREELVPLSWRDVTPDGDVTIRDAITSYGGVTYQEGTKSEFSERVVRLPSSIARRLNDLRGADDDPIMVNRRGKRMRPDDVSRAYKRWQETLPNDLPRIPMKDLRHTSLTLTLEGGADLLAVSRRAGHSSTAITAAYYLRPHKHVDEAAADGLDDLLSGAIDGSS